MATYVMDSQITMLVFTAFCENQHGPAYPVDIYFRGGMSVGSGP